MTDETDKSQVASIKFTQSTGYDNGRDPSRVFEAGVTYHDLPLRFADRFVKRGVAEFASEEDAKKAKGASSDVSLKLQDPDRADESVLRGDIKESGESDAAKRDREANEAAASKKAEDDDLSKKTLAELKAIAADRGVTVEGTTKADYVKAIEQDDAAKPAAVDGAAAKTGAGATS